MEIQILKMILVSRLKRILKKIGNEVINCTIKKSGLCFFINLRRGKNENINIIIKVNLLFKNPPRVKTYNFEFRQIYKITLSELD